MPFRNMSLDELARHIGMDAREVRRLADKGTLPGQRVAGEWRFNRAALVEWLQRELPSFAERDLWNLEKAMGEGEVDPGFTAMLPPEGVEINLPARSRSSVLRELVVVAQRTGLVYDADGIIEALREREELCSTGLPGGIALPHPRRPLPYATAEPIVCVGRVPAGIPFGAPDGRMTDVFILICCHDEKLHLRTLARIALMCREGLAEIIRDADDNAAALEGALELERRTRR